MILNNNLVEVKTKGIYSEKNQSNLIVLDVESIKYGEDKTLFEYNLEILNVIREAEEVNKLCKNLNSNFFINTSIFYKIIDALMTNKEFEDSVIQEYFKTIIEIEKFIHASSLLIDTDNILCLPYEIDFLILGTKNALTEQQINDITDSYGDLLFEMRYEKISVVNFIKEAKELVSNTEKIVVN